MTTYEPADFQHALHDHTTLHNARTKRLINHRIRAALTEEGVDPDAVERVARRAQAGEFDPPHPEHTIRDDL